MSTASSIAQLKASFHPITVLQLQQYDIEGFEDQMKAWVEETPHLFQGMPIILDVSCLTQQKEHLTVLIDKLRHYGVMPIGIQNAELDQQQLAKQMGLGVFTAKKKASAPSLSPGLTKQNKPIAPMMVEGVRSGQKIHAKGDLIVLGSVSAGAEVSAAGNIHVYGTLAGRALAGTQDNKKACLFCMNIQAELVAIAGYYWQYADLQAFASKSICIYLSDERLQARSLG